MAEISITTAGEGQFDVQVTQGVTTTHRLVTVPAALLQDLGRAQADSEAVVRESFRFLLKRGPSPGDPRRVLPGRHPPLLPQYREELRRALGR